MPDTLARFFGGNDVPLAGGAYPMLQDAAGFGINLYFRLPRNEWIDDFNLRQTTNLRQCREDCKSWDEVAQTKKAGHKKRWPAPQSSGAATKPGGRGAGTQEPEARMARA
ncbi:hypothetical protein SBA4_4790005 [Candidatus Sulfopaludibacter sp. SbA4]|nr:hypothetical protein SBA4_4790005 [Candidatus Sulfopaludibacter sp. SbA4]